MDKELMKKAKILSSRNYTLTVFEDTLSDGTLIYMAKNPELAGCMAQGETIEKAIENLADARIDYIYDSLEDGMEVPAPSALPIQTAFTMHPGQTIITESVLFGEAINDVPKPSQSRQLYEARINV